MRINLDLQEEKIFQTPRDTQWTDGCPASPGPEPAQRRDVEWPTKAERVSDWVDPYKDLKDILVCRR